MPKPKTKVAKGIDSFFSKKDDVIEHIIDKSESKCKDLSVHKEKKLDIVEEFYKSLTPSEKIAHELAESMLGTSYDVMRTHGFLQWLKSKKE